METAVSLPDELFRQAETAANQLKVSRSELYALALTEFLQRQRAAAVTEQLNHVYGRSEFPIDPALQRAQLSSLDEESW